MPGPGDRHGMGSGGCHADVLGVGRWGRTYVHGYSLRESERLADQAGALVELLYRDTWHPLGSTVLEAGRGVGAQTVTLARQSPGGTVYVSGHSADSVAAAVRARIVRPRLRLLRRGVSRGRRYRLPVGTGM